MTRTACSYWGSSRSTVNKKAFQTGFDKGIDRLLDLPPVITLVAERQFIGCITPFI